MHWIIPDVPRVACRQAKSSFETRTCLADFTDRLHGDQISFGSVFVVDTNPIETDVDIGSVEPTSSGLGLTFVLSGGSRGDYLLVIRVVTVEGAQVEGLARLSIV